MSSEQSKPTSGYRGISKSYVLVSGLLASRSLLGVTIETKDKWGITIQSPNGVPLILISLVLYLGYRLIVEWVQCDANYRNNKAARLDFGVSHFIALTALAIPTIQFLIHRQIVDVIVKDVGRHLVVVKVFAFIIGCAFLYVTLFMYEDEKAKVRDRLDMVLLEKFPFLLRFRTKSKLIRPIFILVLAGILLWAVGK
jgi:hypothetical protein